MIGRRALGAAIAALSLTGCTPEPATPFIVYPVSESVTSDDKEMQHKDLSGEPPLRILVVPETQTVVVWPAGNLARCSAMESDCKKDCAVLDTRTWECTREFIDNDIHFHEMDGDTYRFTARETIIHPSGRVGGDRITIRVYEHRTWLRRAWLLVDGLFTSQ